MSRLPDKFIERLRNIIPEDRLKDVNERFVMEQPVSFRLNTLHPESHSALMELSSAGINYDRIEQIEHAYYCDRRFKEGLINSPLHNDGSFYLQAASSMLITKLLDPQKGDRILDMCVIRSLLQGPSKRPSFSHHSPSAFAACSSL